jgi:hypothetical protein
VIGTLTPGAVNNTAVISGSGMTSSVNSNTLSITVEPAPDVTVTAGHTGTFTQGSTGTVTVTGHNIISGSKTHGTTTVVDTLPSGYTLNSFNSAGNVWTCGSITNVVTCTNPQQITGVGDYTVLNLIVNIPAASPVSVTNNVTISGGGELSTYTGNDSSSDTITVVQVPATITTNLNTTPQTAPLNTAFAVGLAVTVKDANSVPIVGESVTFLAPSTGASGTFSNTTDTITVTTVSGGVATGGVFTANGMAGPYTASASASTGSATAASFSLINTDTAPTVTNLSSTTLNGSYTTGANINITITFSKAVNVTGTPQLALSSGGTATYSTGSGGSTLTFLYSVLAGQNSSHLDATSTTALTLNGGTITDAATTAAVLTLPTPGATGSLGANTAIVINTTAPTVVSYNVLWGSQSYNVIGTTRNRLPWQITGIKVVFSEAIATGNVNSLSGTGVTTTGFSGLGTNTLTWTINPLAIGNFPTTLAGSGANALKDAAGNALGGGTGFSQNLKLLYGDFNDDGVVNSQDLVLVEAAISAPYNILADMNGDGAVTSADYLIVRTRSGTSLP